MKAPCGSTHKPPRPRPGIGGYLGEAMLVPAPAACDARCVTVWLVGAGILLLVGGGVGLQRWRLGRRAARTLGAAGLTSRAAARWVGQRVRAVGRDEAERDRLRQGFHLRTAEDVAATMGAMKGAMMKLAQMASYVDAGLPETYRTVLASLQAHAPPMTFEL